MKKRTIDKASAEKEYNILQKQLHENTTMNPHDKHQIISSMDVLKKQFIHIKREQINTIKQLITSHGASYINAPGEADELCASLVIKNKAWACLSEDMDMFVYGTPRIMRYFSLINHTAVMYDLEGILLNLGMTQKELREICVLAGTDYNENINNNLHKSLKLFNKYYKTKKENTNMDNKDQGFYTWLMNENKEKLVQIYNMFASVDNISCENIPIIKGEKNKEALQKILEQDRFIF